MSNRLLTIAWGVPLPTTKKMVLLRLADFADDNGRRVFPSVARLAHECGTSERTVQYALRDLETDGFIVVVGNATGGRGRAREYAVLVERLLAAQEPYEKGANDDTTSERLQPATEKGATDDKKGATHCTPSTTEPPVEPPESPPAVPPSLNGAHLDLGLPDPVDEMVAAWNAMAAEIGVPAVQHVTQQRRTKALARRKDLGGIAGWHDCLNKIRGSPLLRGEAKDWRATFDWVLEPRNLTKIMEGNYDDRSSGRAKDRRGGAVDDGRRRELALGAVEALGGHDGRWSASKGRA